METDKTDFDPRVKKFYKLVVKTYKSYQLYKDNY